MGKIYLMIVIFTLCTCSTHSKVNVFSDFLKNERYIVVGENVNVRSAANINSEVLTQLNITQTVFLIKRSDIEYKKGNVVGEWVFINTRIPPVDKPNETIEGWVVDYFLAQGHQFEKVRDFYEFKFYDGYGDYVINYDFKRDGTFIYNVTEYCSEKRGMKITDKIKGVLWRYRNVLIAEAGGMVDYFHIDNGRLCFAESSEICTALPHPRPTQTE